MVSNIRLTAIASAEGWTKFTVSCDAMLKLCQLSDSWLVAWLMVVVAPELLMLPAPDVICPPIGAARVRTEVRAKTAATSARIDALATLEALLPRPLAISETTVQARMVSFQISR